MFNRSSGILMHITSLPSEYGIGTLGKEAFAFVDFLKKAGQSYWQILPLGTTGYGDSPYQSFSAFAGNHLLIDLEMLVDEGFVSKRWMKNLDYGDDPTEVDYTLVNDYKMKLLRKSFRKGYKRYKLEIEAFVDEQQEWLEDFALFMALKEHHKLRPWQTWDEDIKFRRPKAMEKYKRKLRKEVRFWEYLQFVFFKQWWQLKNYANEHEIEIIGDIPVYVASDSSDTWSHPEIFQLDEKREPIKVAGCPPDAFSETGQLWGNPIYDWKKLEHRGYDWWIKRLEADCKLYDAVRIDHFRGFESYWEIPFGEKTAINGKWIEGPAMKLFDAIKESLGDLKIIAEDLGYLTQEVLDFRDASGFPGMKVMQFAFDTREESDYLPHNYDKHCIVYTGTHDNDTVAGWFANADSDDVDHAIKYLKLSEKEGYHWGFIRGPWSPVGTVVMAQMQDFLNLGTEARMNIPSTIGGNWVWRVQKDLLTDDLAESIMDITKLYGRWGK